MYGQFHNDNNRAANIQKINRLANAGGLFFSMSIKLSYYPLCFFIILMRSITLCE